MDDYKSLECFCHIFYLSDKCFTAATVFLESTRDRNVHVHHDAINNIPN